METCATDSLKKVKILNWFDSFRGMVLREKQKNVIMTDSRILMSVPEASRALGIGVRTLREFIARRRIKSVRIGRRVLLRKQDLEKFVEGRVV